MRDTKKIPVIIGTVFGLLAAVGILIGTGTWLNRLEDTGAGRADSSVSWNENTSSRSAVSVYDGGGHRSHAGTYTYPGHGTQSYELSIFDDYEIEIPFGEVIIRPAEGKAPYVDVKCDKELDLRIREDGNTCELTFDARGNNWFGSQHTFIDIYLPEECLKELEVTLKAGKLDVSGIRAGKLDIDVLAGEAEVSQCVFDEISSDMTAGDLTIQADLNVRKIDCEVTAGSTKLYLPKDIAGFTVDYEANVGSLRNESGFLVKGSESGLIGRTGLWNYGDGSCRIELEVTAGELVLDEY